MPDLISPLGSSGQIPVSPSPITTSTSTSSEVGSTIVQTATQTSQAATVLGLSDAASQALKNSRAAVESNESETAPMSLREAAQAFQDYLENLPSDLKFQVDEESGYVICKVVNPVTREVIRQYPPDEVVKMAKHIKAFLQEGKAGIFLDESS
jgi:flagellar protein FlaG